MIIFYIIMGSLFTYFAINSGQPVLSFRTLLPAAIATYDFAIVIRMIRMKTSVKNDKNLNK